MNLRTLKRRTHRSKAGQPGRQKRVGRAALASLGAATLALSATAAPAAAADVNHRVTETEMHDGNPPTSAKAGWYRSSTSPGAV